MESKNKLYKNNFEYYRYMLFRYSIALFLFSNMYWLFMFLAKPTIGMIGPIVLLLGIVPAMIEQFKVYGKEKHESSSLKYTKRFFILQSVLNSLNIIAIFSRHLFTLLFPILTFQKEVQLVIGIVNIVGIVISLFNLRKIDKMNGSV